MMDYREAREAFADVFGYICCLAEAKVVSEEESSFFARELIHAGSTFSLCRDELCEKCGASKEACGDCMWR